VSVPDFSVTGCVVRANPIVEDTDNLVSDDKVIVLFECSFKYFVVNPRGLSSKKSFGGISVFLNERGDLSGDFVRVEVLR
jgi:hypothetical protein